MNPVIYDITLSNDQGLFIVSDIWITENEGGLNRATSEAIYLAKDSIRMDGEINYVSHTTS